MHKPRCVCGADGNFATTGECQADACSSTMFSNATMVSADGHRWYHHRYYPCKCGAQECVVGETCHIGVYLCQAPTPLPTRAPTPAPTQAICPSACLSYSGYSAPASGCYTCLQHNFKGTKKDYCYTWDHCASFWTDRDAPRHRDYVDCSRCTQAPTEAPTAQQRFGSWTRAPTAPTDSPTRVPTKSPTMATPTERSKTWSELIPKHRHAHDPFLAVGAASLLGLFGCVGAGFLYRRQGQRRDIVPVTRVRPDAESPAAQEVQLSFIQ